MGRRPVRLAPLQGNTRDFAKENGAVTGADYEEWSDGYGVIAHAAESMKRIAELADRLVGEGIAADHSSVFRTLAAADRLANAGMWTVAHMTYALRVDLSGQPLAEADLKSVPEGHTGGSLNMVPAYVGFSPAMS